MSKVGKLVSLCIGALFVVCPLLFFNNLTRIPYYTQIALLNILVPAIWLVWLIEAWQSGEFVWKRTPLDWVLGVLTLLCALSWFNAAREHPVLWKPIYSEGSKAFIFWIVNACLVFGTAVRSADKKNVRTLLWMTYAVTAFASIYGVAQHFGTEWFWPHNLNPYGSRPVSTFGNPNFLSSFLVIVFPVAVADFVFKATGLPRPLLFGVILSSFLALLATLTRSSWAGAMVGLVVLGMGMRLSQSVWEKIRKPALLLLLAFFVAVAMWPKTSSGGDTVMGRLTEIKEVTRGSYASVTQRLLIWVCAWEMTERHPILGQGWGCFELFYPYYQGPQLLKEAFRGLRTHANNAHNEILEYGSQVGLLGLGWVIFLWIVFFRLGGSIANRQNTEWKALTWGLLGGVAGMLVDNLLNVSVHFAVPAFLFWWWVGMVLAMDPAGVDIHRIEVRSKSRQALIALGCLSLILLMARSACLWAQEVNFFEGFKWSKAGELVQARQSLETAYRLHELEVNNNYELANVLARTGEKQKAVEMYARALDANSSYDEIYFNLATILTQMKNTPEAIRNYRICLGINPLSREAYNALTGLYLRDIPQNAPALEDLARRSVEAFPGDKDLWNNYGYIETQLQHWPQAVEGYQKAIAIDPQFDLARKNLAAVLPHLRAPSQPATK